MLNLFLKKKDMLLWEVEDLPALYSCASSSAPFEINKLDDVTMEIKEKRQIEKALARFHGDRVKAAQLLGYSRSEFLQKLLFFKIR
jgi:DNA-binding NtrC family response regulator